VFNLLTTDYALVLTC